jgi:NADH dehydrogenase
MNLPTDKKGWVLCARDGRVQGMTNVWGIGDCAVNPDISGHSYPATAQAAVGEGEAVAATILLAAQGRATRPINFRIKGTVTPLGGHNAVVQLGRRFFSGYPAWLVYRLFYLTKIPGFARKTRVALDWFGSLFTPGDALQLNLHPRRPAPLPERRGYEESLVGAGNGRSTKSPS